MILTKHLENKYIVNSIAQRNKQTNKKRSSCTKYSHTKSLSPFDNKSLDTHHVLTRDTAAKRCPILLTARLVYF